MRLLVTRPQPDADRQVNKLAELGHEAIISPLLEVEFLESGPLPVARSQAVIATSRNALRALAARGELAAALHLPIFTVGAATANLAQQLGFGNIHQGPGTAEALVRLIASECAAQAGAVIHLAGNRLAFDLKSALEDKGFEVAQPVLYRTQRADSFSKDARAALATGALDGVVLMSPLTAQTYISLVAASDLPEMAVKLTFFCLSQNVAGALGALEGARILVSSSPSEDDLLALIGHQTAHC